MPTPIPDLIGSAEAAEILDVDRATVTRWVQAGRLKPALQLDGLTGSRLFRRSDVQALKTEREQSV